MIIPAIIANFCGVPLSLTLHIVLRKSELLGADLLVVGKHKRALDWRSLVSDYGLVNRSN